jgi:hypothetical protein
MWPTLSQVQQPPELSQKAQRVSLSKTLPGNESGNRKRKADDDDEDEDLGKNFKF